jgi:hypothetical protein
MYTVKELIDALRQCPEDYQVKIYTASKVCDIDTVGIDLIKGSVDLFAEKKEGN